jgi:hypothetical protein
MSTAAKPLGSMGAHLFVTRAATLSYQTMTRAPFETARRALTERLLSATPSGDGSYLVGFPGDPRRQLRAYVLREGNLLVVTKLVELNP